MAGGSSGHAPLAVPVRSLPRHADGRVSLVGCLDALAPALLLASDDGHGWSYVVPTAGPRLVDDGRRTTLIDGPARHDLGGDPFAALAAVCDAAGVHPDAPTSPGLPAFTGGLVGAFAYELGARIERISGHARRDRSHPDLALWLAEHVLAVPPSRDEALLVGRPLATGRPGPARAPWRERTTELLERLRAAGRHAPGPLPRPRPDPQRVATSLPATRYLAAIEEVLARIAAGDAFQVNLTQRLTARWPGTVVELAQALAAESPAPFGAVLPALGIASISPESFLAVDGRAVTTRPIKGTRPRAADPALDAALADDLATAVKDRAENVMVVDMERNDLGRVCRPGSVRVPQLTEVEAHPTVWHLVSTVRGELAAGVGYGELLRATFPCGSITGAPKVAAMGLIDALEPVTRGWYCGSIGFLSPGAARLSVAIRTATLAADGTVDYGAGGGIVADSDPQAELAESLDKAVAFLRAVGATEVVDGPLPAVRRAEAHR